MAASILPKPGTNLLCKRCEHIDCKETRACAASLCRFCTMPIGYGVRYYREPGDTFVHALCLEHSVEDSKR